MTYTAKKIASMIRANVAAVDANKITWDQFGQVNRATWDLASNDELRDYVLMDANCPCCQREDICDEGCTFENDCPHEFPRFAAARALLAKHKEQS